MRHTRRVSPISTTQQGFIAEREFMKLLMLGSDGELEVMAPATDDERRDLETHIRGKFTPGFIFQVKSTTYLDRRFKARRLSIHFLLAKVSAGTKRRRPAYPPGPSCTTINSRPSPRRRREPRVTSRLDLGQRSV